MKKSIKSITLALVVALATLCLGICATACKDKDTDVAAYSVYVVYADGTPVNGHTDGTGFNINDPGHETYVFVKWCNENGCPTPVMLGTDGKASITVSEMEKAGFKEGNKGVPTYVEIINLKAEYGTTVHQDITGLGEVKITINKAS